MFTIEFLIDYCQENSNSQILNVARNESVDRFQERNEYFSTECDKVGNNKIHISLNLLSIESLIVIEITFKSRNSVFT